MKNAHLVDETEIRQSVNRGRWMVRELIGVIQVRSAARRRGSTYRVGMSVECFSEARFASSVLPPPRPESPLRNAKPCPNYRRGTRQSSRSIAQYALGTPPTLARPTTTPSPPRRSPRPLPSSKARPRRRRPRVDAARVQPHPRLPAEARSDAASLDVAGDERRRAGVGGCSEYLSTLWREYRGGHVTDDGRWKDAPVPCVVWPPACSVDAPATVVERQPATPAGKRKHERPSSYGRLGSAHARGGTVGRGARLWPSPYRRSTWQWQLYVSPRTHGSSRRKIRIRSLCTAVPPASVDRRPAAAQQRRLGEWAAGRRD